MIDLKNDEILIPHSMHKELLVLERWTDQFPWLVAGFTTRHGGNSRDPFHSLNCGLHVGDHSEDVVSNRRRLLQLTGYAEQEWVSANQTHSDHLYHVQPTDGGKGLHTLDSALQDIDGIFTDSPDLFLASFYADCVPLFFLDPVKRIIGMAHAGWKGTLAQIGPKMIKEWQSKFQSDPDHILAVIGPSIGGCCYEVDESVIEAFLQVTDINEFVIPTNHRKYMLDLKKCNVEFLKKAGLKGVNIEVSSWCTSCHVDLFYSHRKEQGRTGRMTAFMGKREEG